MARRKPPTTHGLAVVDKPAGVTSHDVVGMLRRRFGERQVGHAGTLDPDATGVLLVGVGKATRLLRFLTALGKTYTGEVVLGTSTSTLDASGEVTATFDMSGVTVDMARAAVGRAPHRPDHAGPADGQCRCRSTASACTNWPARGSRSSVSRGRSRSTRFDVDRHRRPVGAAHRGALLGGHLHPHARRRPRPAARRRRAPAQPAAHGGRQLHRRRGAPPDDVRAAVAGRRRCATTPQRRRRRADGRHGPPRPGARPRSTATGRGRSSTRPGRCWRCTSRSARSAKPAVVIAVERLRPQRPCAG